MIDRVRITSKGSAKMLISFFLSFIFSQTLHAQIIEGPNLATSSVQNPTNLNWKKISSENFDILYPEDLSQEAIEALSILETIYQPVSQGLKVSVRKIPIILQNQTLNSNGFVTLAPRRSEFFTTPWLGPEIGQTEWIKTLAVHEFRHVAQFEKSREGFSKFLHIILGEIGTALAIGLTLPPWYLEGDAVGIETALTSGGRGRIPMFELEFRALLLAGQKFNYDQLALGSFDRYRPSLYVTGYFFTTYLKKHYGKEILERIHYETMDRAYNPLAFYNAIEKFCLKDFDVIYQEALDEFHEMWKIQREKIIAGKQKNSVQFIKTPKEEDWVSYSYPHIVDNKLIAYRQGLSFIGQFVEVNSKEEEVLWTPNPLLQSFPFKVRNKLMATSEQELHPRWGAKDYSKVVVRDVLNNKIVFKKSWTRWLLPVLDHEAKNLAVYEWKPAGSTYLKVLKLSSEKIIQTFPWPVNKPVMGMDWLSSNDGIIILYKENTYDLVFAILDFKSGNLKEIARTKKWNWSYPHVFGDYVYFQSPQSGIDNIHRISLKTGIEERVTDDEIGAFHPSFHGESLVYARYTAYGLKPTLASSPLKSYPLSNENSTAYFQTLVEQEGKGDLVESINLITAKEEDYKQAGNSFNPHSWLILAPPLTPFVTAQVRSTNLLNTLDLTAGAQWDLNERVAQGFASVNWVYWWPMFDVRAGFGSRRLDNDKWQEGSSQLGVSLPYSSYNGRFNQNAKFRLFGEILNTNGREKVSVGDLSSETIGGGGAELSWSFLQRMSLRDLMPPLGIDISLMAKSLSNIEESATENFQRTAKSFLYLPSFFKHHHLYGELSYEEQRVFGYQFVSPVFFSRGHTALFMEEKNKASVNYTFPVFYPEWSLSRYLYLKRVAVNLFHDNLWGKRYEGSQRFESFGGELLLDTHIARNALNLQWGIRVNQPVGDNVNFDVFLNTGVASF